MRTFLIIFIFVFFVVFFFKDFNNSDYYPKSSFVIPKELMDEMIASRSASSVKLPIVMYHYVEYADPKDPGRVKLSISPSVFESQLQAIKKDKFGTAFAKDIPSLITLKNSKSVALTFDDGYEDFYYYAFPLLKKYHMKGTIYVISNFIGRKGYLNEAQIKEMITSGFVELGAHTLNHAYLKDLKEVVAWKEISESKIFLEKKFGIPVLSFAYPFGAFSKETVELVKKAGFTNAVSVVPGIYQHDTNEYFLFRIRPGYINTSNFTKSLEMFNK